MNLNHPGPISVLLADDSPIVRHRLSELLSEDPRIRVVGEAADAAEAINLFEALRPDAAVLDYRLPDATGLEVLRHIKESAPWCVVIMLTNLREEVFGEVCRACGADHFFHKATEFEKVGEVLGDLAGAVSAGAPANKVRQN